MKRLYRLPILFSLFFFTASYGMDCGDTPLHKAVSLGNESAVRVLMCQQWLHKKDCLGNTPLHEAVNSGNESIVRLLLKSGAMSNVKNCFGDTLLHRAVVLGHVVIARLLLKAGALSNERDGCGRTPLIEAVSMGAVGIIYQLLKFGAKPDEPDESGRTPLIEAVSRGATTVVHQLLSFGAKPNKRDKCGRIPLHEAVSRGSVGIVSELLRSGAKQNKKDSLGNTPLYKAIAMGDIEVISRLLSFGADPNIPTEDGRMPLCELIELSCEYACWRTIVQQLYQAGISVESWAMRFAPSRFALGATMFLQAGADPNVKYYKGGTLLHNAARMSGVSFLKELRFKQLRQALGHPVCEPVWLKYGTESIRALLGAGAELSEKGSCGHLSLMTGMSIPGGGALEFPRNLSGISLDLFRMK